MPINPQPLDLFLTLLAAHLLGDFVFQTAGDVRNKHRWPILLKHGLILALCAYVIAGRWARWEIPAVTFITHVVIDLIKVRAKAKGLMGFVVDQLAHLAVILGLVCLWGWRSDASYWLQLFGPAFARSLAVVCGAIICVRIGGFVVGFWVQPYLKEIEAVRPKDEMTALPMERGLVNGGRVIGQWERALIFFFVLVGQPAGVGFLIAAKSVFRFGELKDRANRMEAEYITIGTLMSFGYAMVTAYVTRWLWVNL